MRNTPKVHFIWHTKKRVYSFSLNNKKLVVLAISILGAVVFLFYLSTGWLMEQIYQGKLQKIRKNNSQLVNTFYDLTNRVQRMESEISLLIEKDKALRTYVDLPSIDTDIRKLGIGGKVTSEIQALDHLLPDENNKLSDLAVNLDRLARQMKFERLSYETIYNAFKNRTNQIQSTPSIRPLYLGYISDGYGYRRDPFTGRLEYHYGIDISAPMGTPVFATADGVVGSVGYKGAYGNIVEINHGFGYTTIYAHLSRAYVRPGEVVKRGQRIGEVGSSGRSTGPHLHYEVLQFNINKNPLDYFFTGLVR
jgi:murein DD-endopeptidase MepM/ murein hydrolase activator NlpD